jgi:hypothetical protein
MPANTPRGYTYPLYTDPAPADFPAAMADFAGDVDADVAALVARQTAALNRASARVSETANQSIASVTNTFATYSVEEYDNAAMANLGVNNDRLTFTETGIYLVTAEVNFSSNGNATVNNRSMRFVANLFGSLNGDTRRGAQNMDTEMTITTLYKVNTVGDFIRVQVRQESGAALNISARSFSATKVAD